MTHMHPPSVFPFFLITTLLISHHLKCEARATMNATTPLYDNGETLVSSKSIFELGFFSPQGNNQSSRYVGVWYYKLIPTTIVWVANRDNPLSDSCGSFGIAEDGSLKVWCDSKEIVTFTAATLNPTLQLLDSGNLILVEGKSVTPLWQSFSNPTDTFLPGMELNGDVKLSSWKSTTDPATGDYTFRKDHEVYVIQKRSVVHWRSGEPGSFQTSDGLPVLVNQLLSDSSQDDNQSLEDNKERRHISYNNIAKAPSFNNNSRLVMAYSGEIQYYSLSEDKSWSLVWLEPTNDCSVYNACGKFGVCELKKEPMCSCPDGFKPSSLEDWSDGHYSEGCDRESTICSRNCSFLKILVMKVGGQATPFDQAETEKACKEECLNNCNCEAYLYRDVNGSDRGRSGESAPKCWIWTAELENLQQDNVDGRYNLSLRVNTGLRLVNPNTEVPKSKSRKRYAIVVIAAIVVGVILVCWSSYILYKRRRMARQSENQGITGGTAMLFSNQSDRQANDMLNENDKRIDVPFYSLDVVLSATNFFSDANKLGQGGFGPVYKGKFPGGCEIAVKRLSSSSVQGIEEFLNEVILIAKLQHRNLVRLLGYCIKANEKILLYEYMPNRSLDGFIFDQHNCLLLDWKKRFDIILGIARGLLYLHQDSRLRIIHRDLKTSNILLDEDMNPKISDFGLARIVEGKGTEASTNKVVGTYGYMSPEYALDGKFSIKSGVFSFGVVVLEIISGKKNTGFYNSHEVLNLLGYAWRLWSENKAHDLIDPTLLESCDKPQAMKCINIGLLCVQEDPYERPSMSTVVIMLGSESAETLPVPTQPAFVVRRRVSSTSSSSVTKPDMISVNEMTFSMAQGR